MPKSVPRRFAFGLALAALLVPVAYTVVQAQTNAPAPTVGSPAPAYKLPDQNGAVHASAQDKGKLVLLAFYPADFTGGCTLEAHVLSAAYPKLKALGVVVYGVSVQDQKSHQSFCSKEGIPYTLLADTHKTVTAAYGDLIPGVGVANRVSFLIGRDGRIVNIDRDVNSHLATYGDDLVAWLAAHPAVTGKKTDAPAANSAASTVQRFTGPLGAAVLGVPHTGPPSVALAAHGPATVGQPAPNFSLPDVATGKLVSLSDYATGYKATVVVFVATRCPVSNAYTTRLAALAKTYGSRGVAFLGVNANTTEPVSEVAAHARQHFPFPVLKDAHDTAADAYQAQVTPEAYMLNPQGVLVYHGRVDNNMDATEVKTHDLAAAIDATLAGKPVAAQQASAFGCSIKRKS